MQRPTRERIAEAYRAALGLLQAGRRDEALAAFRRLVAAEPKLAEAHFQIARLLALRGALPDARAAIEAALKLRPREEALWIGFAEIARQAPGGLAPGAVVARARKAGLAPEALARLEERLRGPTERGSEPPVPEAARRLLKQSGEAALAGREAEAKRLLDSALEKAPGAAPLLVRRAEVLLTLGDLAAAVADTRAAVAAAPEVGGYWRVWARAAKVKPDDPLLANLERRHADAAPGGEDRRQMGYALAKAMEDIGAHDRVFGYLNEANAITAQRYPYNLAADQETAARIRRGYTRELVARWRGEGASDTAPIFVTGLPRTGTTLVEQILASHSAVTGGGELGLLYKPLSAVVNSVLSDGIEAGAGFAEVGRDYGATLAQRFPGAARVTDKSIATYALLGYVPLAMPRSRIVVVRRNPRDACLSVLKTQFEDSQHRYSYSMQATAEFYKLFATQVAFWCAEAPEAFIEVWYEDLVADLEGQARRLLAYCDLPWEDGVLDFHRTERSVKTLSTAQVRQPLYASSVAAWKRYEADLAPLLAALGPIDELP